ncbi:hypothetical protein ACFL6S_04865 [Candidatus Poribacteria bacterium]
MAELIVTRLDPISDEWEHNHSEGPTGTQEEGAQWLAALREGKVPEGKSCQWEEVVEITDEWTEVSNLRFGPYAGPDAGKLLHSLKRARLTVNL